MTSYLTGRKAGLEREHATKTKVKTDECSNLQQWFLCISAKDYPLLKFILFYANRGSTQTV